MPTDGCPDCRVEWSRTVVSGVVIGVACPQCGARPVDFLLRQRFSPTDVRSVSRALDGIGRLGAFQDDDRRWRYNGEVWEDVTDAD